MRRSMVWSLQRNIGIQAYTLTGYATFLPDNTEYNLAGAPKSWARIPALRHALTKYPHSTYFWFLDQHALIMNPDLRLESHIMNPSKLESLLLKNQPVVPPESVIKTFPNLKGSQIDFVITQDKDGLAPGSLIIRRGEWTKFFLDTWFDPLYRSYNFQKADVHALVSRLACSIGYSVLTLSPGTHRAMAPYNPFEAGHHPRKNHERPQ